MESISELRKICQSTRPSIFSDFLSGIYYKTSIYLTWCCLKLRLSANQVTVLSVVMALLGSVLLAFGGAFYAILGALCFHLFAILDMSDGEVARYRKQGGMKGHFLDWYMHFIASPALVLGIFIAAYIQTPNLLVVIFGSIATISTILDKSISNCAWTAICWTRMREIKRVQEGGEVPQKKCLDEEAASAPKTKNRVVKLIKLGFLMPFQDRWASILILLLAISNWICGLFTGVSIPYQIIWIGYMGLVAPIYLCLQVKKLMESNAISRAYQRVFDSQNRIQFPRDDFFH